MSSIVNKVKDALSTDKSTETTHSSTTHNTSSGAPEGTYGPHGSRVANAADPRVDSDRDGSRNAGGARTAGHGEYGSSTGGYVHGTGPTHASHDTGLAASTGSAGFGQHAGSREGEHGPHSSRLANAADPRVDSDRDGSNKLGRTAGHGEYGSTTGGYTHGTGPTQGSHTTGLGATTGSAGFGHHAGSREGEHGPHSSRLANAADPRVDSDRDGSRNAAPAGSYTVGTTGYGSSGHHGPIEGFTTGSNSGVRKGEHGPHSSRTANALDPRVDSDRDGSRTAGNQGYGSTGQATTGTSGFGSSTHHTANAGHTTGATGATGNYGAHSGLGHSSSGPAPNTAGPHKSDMLNKLDPRVDSDLDGSKTTGGNKTFSNQHHNRGVTAHRDPTDAAQVPPSVLRETIGEPTVEHGDHSHGRQRRNSSATHQETFSGV